MKLEALKRTFDCCICLDTIDDAYVVPDCQHRFCGKCIKESLRKCRNECPECRTEIRTKRHLRRDGKFNDLVQGIISASQLLRVELDVAADAPPDINSLTSTGSNGASAGYPSTILPLPIIGLGHTSNEERYESEGTKRKAENLINPSNSKRRLLIGTSGTEDDNLSRRENHVIGVKNHSKIIIVKGKVLPDGSNYNGEWDSINNYPHGKGKSNHSEDGSMYIGEWQCGKPHGRGKEICCADGSIYSGGFQDGKSHGNGKLILSSQLGISSVYQELESGENSQDPASLPFNIQILSPLFRSDSQTRVLYEGEWRQDIRHGKGRHSWADGSSYEGEWANDHRHGKGKHSWADGSTYEGEWEDDERHGKGKHTWSDGSMYEGECRRGKRFGLGKHTWADGSTYSGQYENGKRCGTGKYTSPDGSIYKGDWENGKQRGKGKCIWSDGSIYDGDWKYDERHGRGEYKSTDGALYVGMWKRNKKHGNGVEKFANGVVCKGRWESGKMIKIVKQVTSTTRDVQVIPPIDTFSREESADDHLHLNIVVKNSSSSSSRSDVGLSPSREINLPTNNQIHGNHLFSQSEHTHLKSRRSQQFPNETRSTDIENNVTYSSGQSSNYISSTSSHQRSNSAHNDLQTNETIKQEGEALLEEEGNSERRSLPSFSFRDVIPNFSTFSKFSSWLSGSSQVHNSAYNDESGTLNYQSEVEKENDSEGDGAPANTRDISKVDGLLTNNGRYSTQSQINIVGIVDTIETIGAPNPMSSHTDDLAEVDDVFTNSVKHSTQPQINAKRIVDIRKTLEAPNPMPSRSVSIESSVDATRGDDLFATGYGAMSLDYMAVEKYSPLSKSNINSVSTCTPQTYISRTAKAKANREAELVFPPRQSICPKTGLYKKPQGRKRKGRTWDARVGAWRVDDTQKKLPQKQNAQLKDHKKMQQKPKARQSRGQPKRKPVKQSKGKPKKGTATNKKLGKGVYQRPPGARQKGTTWDASVGNWVPKAQLKKVEKEVYQRPTGARRKGTTWDASAGGWVPKSRK